MTLTINPPERCKPNSDPAVVQALLTALERLKAEPKVCVAILTGTGSDFCSGGNVRSMRVSEGLGGERPPRSWSNYITGIQRLPTAFARLEIPVITAVNLPDRSLLHSGRDRPVRGNPRRLGLVPTDIACGCCGGSWVLCAREMALTCATRGSRWPRTWCRKSCRTTSCQARSEHWRSGSQPVPWWQFASPAAVGAGRNAGTGGFVSGPAHTADDQDKTEQAFLEKRSAQFIDN